MLGILYLVFTSSLPGYIEEPEKMYVSYLFFDQYDYKSNIAKQKTKEDEFI